VEVRGRARDGEGQRDGVGAAGVHLPVAGDEGAALGAHGGGGSEQAPRGQGLPPARKSLQGCPRSDTHPDGRAGRSPEVGLDMRISRVFLLAPAIALAGGCSDGSVAQGTSPPCTADSCACDNLFVPLSTCLEVALPAAGGGGALPCFVV